jgi:S-adenosylmethionine:tRNA ribosyltransferase-isomerase
MINRGLQVNEIILHVGLGTFKPIDTDDVNNHEMHAERIQISKSTIEHLLVCTELNKNIIAVGTTTTRTLESIYWLGVRLIENPELEILTDSLIVEQFEPYQERDVVPVLNAIKAVNNYFEAKGIQSLLVRTSLFIVPGYDFKFVNILVTNFHQPDSTLILLVAAFLGAELWKAAYEVALSNEYRFLSYGDANLLIREIK